MRAIDRYKMLRRTHGAILFGVVFGLPLGACTFGGYAMGSMWGAILASTIPAAAIGLLLLAPRLTAPLQRELRSAGGAICPGCGYLLANNRSGTCPECGEHWTPETARDAWRRAMGPVSAKVLPRSSEQHTPQ